jgi:hypothetical protein
MLGRKMNLSAWTRPKVSEETRLKQSIAKTGARNSKSRPIVATGPEGTKSFESVSGAASFFGVSQQTMDMWVRGVVAWPGSSPKTRKRNRWIADWKLVTQ